MCIRDRLYTDRILLEAYLREHLGVDGETARLENTQDFDRLLAAGLERQFHMADHQAEAILKRVRRPAWPKPDRDTYQAMEGFVHTLTTCLLYTSSCV